MKDRKIQNQKYVQLPKNVFRHDLHIELWNWLAENPTKGKSDWPRWISKGGNVKLVETNCFACEFALCAKKESCKNCPFELELRDNRLSVCLNGLFFTWLQTSNRSTGKRKELALMIRDFHLRHDWEWTDVEV